jgi:hypothetical protein
LLDYTIRVSFSETLIYDFRLLGFFEDMTQRPSQGGYEKENVRFDTTRSRMISLALVACEGFRVKWLERSIRRWKKGGFIGG